jgi:DNA-binding transcriptional MerR regulator
LELAQAELGQFEAQGIIRAVRKNGRTYYSARDFYRLKGVLHFMRTKGLSLDQAQDEVANWNGFAQAASPAS